MRTRLPARDIPNAPSSPGLDRIVYDPRDNPDLIRRRWVVSRAGPIMPLLASDRYFGAALCFTKSQPPPRDLIGKTVSLHAGAGTVPIAPIRGVNGTDPKTGAPFKPARYEGGSLAAQRAIAMEAGCEPEGWREGLGDLQRRTGGRIIGEARLIGAFVQGTCHVDERGFIPLSPDRPDSHGRFYLGRWQEFWRQYALPLGNWHAPDKQKKKRRWVWCFDQPRRFAQSMSVPCKGFGGLIWDQELGLAKRKAEAEAEDRNFKKEDPKQ